MKVAIQCVSPLLQRSLERFLQGHLSSIKQCDIVVRDNKIDDGHPSLLISSYKNGGDLQKPFSRSQLFLALEKRLEEQHVSEHVNLIEHDEHESSENLEILERRIVALTQEYQQNIIKAIRAFHEK